jgi:hypothetical protein
VLTTSSDYLIFPVRYCCTVKYALQQSSRKNYNLLIFKEFV